jgi:hypothetical protein
LSRHKTVTAYSKTAAQFTYFFSEDSAFRAFSGQGYIGLRAREQEVKSLSGAKQHKALSPSS